jgi:hypothetical protein
MASFFLLGLGIAVCGPICEIGVVAGTATSQYLGPFFMFLALGIAIYSPICAFGAVAGTAASQSLGPRDGIARSRALFFGAAVLTVLQAGIPVAMFIFDASWASCYLFTAEILLIGWGTPIVIDMEHDISRWWETLLISVMVSPVTTIVAIILILFWFVSLPVLTFITIKLGIRMSRLKAQVDLTTRSDQSSQQLYCAVVTELTPMEKELPILAVV